MFGQTRRRTIIESPLLAAMGPVRIERDGAESMVKTLADEQRESGGLIQARLEAVPGQRVRVILRYSAHKFAVGHLTPHVAGERLHAEVLRLARRGYTVACSADILDDGSGGHEIWLKPQLEDQPTWAAPEREARGS